jgi:uncharacterized membrane protein YfcA
MASFYVGVTKSGFAGGTGIVVTPLLAMVLPPRDSLAIALPLLLASDIVNFGLFWGKWHLPVVGALLPGAIAGILLGTRILVCLPELWVKRTLAVLALAFVPLQVARMTVWADVGLAFAGGTTGVAVGLAAGFIAGVTSTLAHLGGLVTTVYFLLALPRADINATMVGTATVLYFCMNGMKLITYGRAGIVHRGILRRVPTLLPALLCGLLVGKAINVLLGGRRVDWFIYIVLLLVVAMAARLLTEAPRPDAHRPAVAPAADGD